MHTLLQPLTITNNCSNIDLFGADMQPENLAQTSTFTGLYSPCTCQKIIATSHPFLRRSAEQILDQLGKICVLPPLSKSDLSPQGEDLGRVPGCRSRLSRGFCQGALNRAPDRAEGGWGCRLLFVFPFVFENEYHARQAHYLIT
jgi:hypothetical protein